MSPTFHRGRQAELSQEPGMSLHNEDMAGREPMHVHRTCFCRGG